MEPQLLEEREPDARGEILTRWALSCGATALVLSASDTSHVIYVGLGTTFRQLLWEEKRVLPMLTGWNVRQTWCVDAWGLRFEGYAVREVVGKMNEVVLAGREYWGDG